MTARDFPKRRPGALVAGARRGLGGRLPPPWHQESAVIIETASYADLTIRLQAVHRGDYGRQYVPAQRFTIHRQADDALAGDIKVRIGTPDPFRCFSGQIGSTVAKASAATAMLGRPSWRSGAMPPYLDCLSITSSPTSSPTTSPTTIPPPVPHRSHRSLRRRRLSAHQSGAV